MGRLALTLVAILAASTAMAADVSLNGMRIVSPQLVLPPPGAASAAAYMALVNDGFSNDRLLAVETTAAMMAMLHETVIGEDGIARMFELPPVILAPGESFSFVGGAAHIMLMHMNGDFKLGDEVPFLLTFQNAGEIPVNFEVVERAPVAEPASK